ncbi:hypothetical protein HN789_06395 [archaeon]|jgi:hypothetical protein|nr:hypothetical protein [archaeon]MBT4022807.1 hypothetical protein [archaeon]MBT4272999.1 hypothetical protein [archaeon]MBT4460910.1 hypothetical protein [archaeon]MBT4858126.1 hypothetical protein [archaeon]
MFSKSFPRTTDKSSYPIWEEIVLSDNEEKEQETLARKENIEKMRESISDAKKIIEANSLKPYQTDMINIAIALFEKRGSHEIYYKENKAKEKFDSKFKIN